MSPRRQRSIVTHLVLWLSLGLVLVAATMALVAYRGTSATLETQLGARADALAAEYATILKPHLWNLDDESIDDLIAMIPPPPDLALLEVLTEYDDIVFKRRFLPAVDTLSRRLAVTHGGEPIGAIRVTMSHRNILVLKKAITRSSLTILGAGILVILLLTSSLMRFLAARPLRAILNTIDQIAAGDSVQNLKGTHVRELDRISSGINTMVEQIADRTVQLRNEIRDRKQAQAELEQLKSRLEDTVHRRTTDLTRTNIRLSDEVRERRQAQAELLTIAGREQARIGHDLHDTLGQQLAGISFLTQSLVHSLQKEDSRSAAAAREIRGLLSDAVEHTRHIAHGLTPVAMVDEGLGAALERLADDIAHLFGVTCSAAGTDIPVADNTVATHLYRIAQEAVSNARRHGAATSINLKLTRCDHQGTLLITDDGRGFDTDNADPASDGMGLRVMRYRAESVGGELAVSSTPQGTRIAVTFPL